MRGWEGPKFIGRCSTPGGIEAVIAGSRIVCSTPEGIETVIAFGGS
jgi:hypothetical protein